MRFLVPMEPKGKARPRVTSRGTYMPSDYRQWKSEFQAHVRSQWDGEGLSGEFTASVSFQTPSGRMRSDLDNAAGAVLDALQDAGVIANDKGCCELFTRRHKGKGYAIAVELEAA